jgi:hypothetical protein
MSEMGGDNPAYYIKIQLQKAAGPPAPHQCYIGGNGIGAQLYYAHWREMRVLATCAQLKPPV